MRTRRARTFSRVSLLAASVLVATGAWSARAEDVTLTVWSHEADEPAKVAFREQAARELREGPPRRPGQDHLVREERPLTPR